MLECLCSYYATYIHFFDSCPRVFVDLVDSFLPSKSHLMDVIIWSGCQFAVLQTQIYKNGYHNLTEQKLRTFSITTASTGVFSTLFSVWRFRKPCLILKLENISYNVDEELHIRSTGKPLKRNINYFVKRVKSQFISKCIARCKAFFARI